MTTVSLIPRGRTFARGAIVKAMGSHSEEQAHNIAMHRWGSGMAGAIAKATVASITTTDTGNVAAREFMGLVAEQSVIGRLSGLRRIPFNVRMLKLTAGATGYWVGQAKPKPLSKPVMTGSTMEPLKVAAIICATKEAMESQEPLAEASFQADLERAVSATLDQAFLDPGNSGVADEVPAAVTNGAPTISATGDLQADLAALIAAFRGDLASAYFVTDPTTATRIALATDAGGRYLFPEAGPRGGAILNIPLLTSRSAPSNSNGGSLALIDPTGIAGNVDEIVLDKATHASLQMEDEPGSGATELVSLWQTNTVAFRAEITANWQVERAGAVVVLEGL